MTLPSNDRGTETLEEVPENAIAIVGMAAHLPGARNVDEFWAKLVGGVECISRFSDEELEAAGVDPALLRDPNYVKANGVLHDMEAFDAGFFGLSPLDAAVMDPQTRHFLECVWHALENAGHDPGRFPGLIGVFAGAGAGQYFWQNVVRDPTLMETVGYFLLRHTGNDKDFLATRASYEFDLTGPSVSVQTACSTSLVAVHMASQSLLSWECDMAIAGGVTIEQPHIRGYEYVEGEILSPDGHCRSFDHESKGTVFGSGAGVVVLRRLADAIEDGDPIHAVIRGSAVNNDGSGKVSYLAPSVDGQAKVIAEALAVADVDARSMGMVEAHGTGTPVGDPIEVTALTQAYRVQTEDQNYCALGSVKSNIGHLDTAAGVASLIKASLAVKSGQIPATLHFEKPNPLLQLDTSPFYVNAECVSWPDGLSPRRAGISSLGVGGTNAHIIVEQPPAPRPTTDSRPWQLLTLSGRSQTALEDGSRGLVDYLEAHPDASLADVAHTLQVGRRRFSNRRALVCRSGEEAVETLSTGQAVGLTNAESDAERREVAFLFAGGGAQYPNMGRELYENEPVFREIVDDCFKHLLENEQTDLKPLLFCDESEAEAAANELQRPSLALPALFTIQYAQARLWMSWGIEPSVMIGHSMGEYTAACIAEVFSVHEALSLVTLRGRLFEKVDRGAMLSVSLGETELREQLTEGVSIAALNAPGVSVASGPVAAIDALEQKLNAAEIDCRRIRIDVAAHSSMLSPILGEFGDYLNQMTFSEPKMNVISNLSGELAGAEVARADYWVRHLRHTVRFSDGIAQTLRPDGPILLEVGPGRTLATVAKMHPQWTKEQPSLHSLPHPTEPFDAQAFQLATLGALWAHGVEVDWEAFRSDEVRNRVTLPGYAFERQNHFVEPPVDSGSASVDAGAEADGARIEDPSAWFQSRQWAPTMLPSSSRAEGTILVLADAGTVGDRLADTLASAGHTVARVRRGPAFSETPDGFIVRPASKEDWTALFGRLAENDALPGIVTHAWCMGAPAEDEGEDLTFFGPLALIQAVESVRAGHAYRFVSVGSGVLPAPGGATEHPIRALLNGPMRVAPKEIPGLQSRLVDVGAPVEAGSNGEARLLERLAVELTSPSEETIVAYRGADRLAERFGAFPLEPGSTSSVREGGTYLITGGFGGIGLVVAHELTEQGPVKLVLTSRSGLPPESERDAYLAQHKDDDKTARAIREVRRLEEAGAEVLVAAADVTDATAMNDVVRSAVDRFGGLNGVIHAAGILDDGPLLVKTAEDAGRVLDAKVRGTQALSDAVEGISLDFMILFSSVSAAIGAPGQIDYVAANAFMDTFARARTEATGQPTLALAWGAWKGVGMAAELAGEARYDRETGSQDGEAPSDLEHPLFDARIDLGPDQHSFRTQLTKDRHWMMDEHRVRDGEWVLPGSGYVELIRAAAAQIASDRAFAMKDLVFLAPFQVDESGTRELDVALEKNGVGWNVTVRGRASALEEWVDHATAHVLSETQSAAPDSLDAVIQRVGEPRAEDRPPHPVMDFGPRWANISGQVTGEREAVLTHVLPADFVEDLREADLHPAVLDMATGGAQHLIPNVDPAVDFLVPAGYGAVTMLEPIGEEAYSHVVLRNADDHGTFASFDVTIYGKDGTARVVIQDFSMIRVDRDALGAQVDAQPSWLRDALSPEEGREAFRRVLNNPVGTHVFVATRPMEALVTEAAQATVRARPSGGASRAPSRVLIPKVAEALAEFEAVEEATAIGGQAGGESARVVAFMVYKSGMHATVSELRRFLRKRLDKEFVPQNFVEMASLPRGADGEVVFEELRDPFAAADDYVAPRTETEEAIASIWADLLALDRVGIHDNFLDVGGHSLVGIRVLIRIQQETGVRIEANNLTMQTLEQLAADVDREKE